LAQDHGGILVNAAYGSGLVGQAFAFVGTNSYGRVPNNPSFSALTNALSLEAWVFMNNPDPATIQRFLTISPDNVVVEFALGKFSFSLALAPNDSSAFHVATATNAVTARQWYHLAATYDGSIQSLYVNGALAFSAQIGPPLVPIGQGESPEIFISFLGAQSLDGLIDEAAVYNRALSAVEVQGAFCSRAGRDVQADEPVRDGGVVPGDGAV
jgi:hypothetical protein